MLDPIEQLWNEILSRQPDKVRRAYAALTAEEKEALRAHLERMTREAGWHPEQTHSAQAALDALQAFDPDKKGP